MKNITVSVPDDVYRRARVRAAEQGRSLSAVVAEFLQQLSDEDSEFLRLEALQKEVQATIQQFSASERLSREEVHSRAIR